VKYLLSKVAANKKVAVLVASHNEESAKRAVDYMKELQISPTDTRVHFAQLMVHTVQESCLPASTLLILGDVRSSLSRTQGDWNQQLQGALPNKYPRAPFLTLP
jgi:hypothetical protein